MKTHWIKTLTVSAGTSLILFQAGADEIEDAAKASQAAEITRSVQDEQAARRALVRAREKLLAESAALDDDPATAAEDAEDLVGEINSLEDLKSKLKRELDSLRDLDVPEETPSVVAESVPAAPVQVGSTPEEWQAFQQSINQRISTWREQDLKQAVEQRAAISREQQSLKDAISNLIEEVDGRIASLTEKRETALSDLASKLEEQQDQLKAQEARLAEQITASQKEVASMTASINEKLDALGEAQAGKDELKSSLESMISDLDAEIKTLKLAQEQQVSGDQQLEELAKEIKRQVAEVSTPDKLIEKLDAVDEQQVALRENLMAEIASLREELAKQPEAAPEAAEVDTAAIEEKIRTELMGEMSKEIERLSKEMTGKQEQTAQALASLKGQLEQSRELADAVETIGAQVEETQAGVASLKEVMDKRAAEAIEGSAALSEAQQAELVQYRKSLKNEVAQLRKELRKALKTEIAELAAAIEVEKTARLESTGEQEAKLAELEKNLKDQIAQSLADMPSGAATDEQAVLAIVNNAQKDLKDDFMKWQGTVEERIETLASAPSAKGAVSKGDLNALKASIDETLALFKKETESRQSQDLSKVEFMLNQYMEEINAELASLKEDALVVASAVAVGSGTSTAEESAEEIEEAVVVAETVDPEEPEVDVASTLSAEEQEQRKSLLELREKLRASIKEYRERPVVEPSEPEVSSEPAEKELIKDLADEMPEEPTEEPVEETPEPKKKKSWFNIWGGGDDNDDAISEEDTELTEESAEETVEDEEPVAEEVEEVEEAADSEQEPQVEEDVQQDINERIASSDVETPEPEMDSEETEAVEDQPKKGFWGRLFGGKKSTPEDVELPGLTATNETDAVEAAATESEEEAPVEETPEEEAVPVAARPEDLKSSVELSDDVEIAEVEPQEAVEVIETETETEPETEPELESAEQEIEEPAVEEVVEETVAEEVEEQEDVAVEEKPKKGFFGRLFGGSKSKDVEDISETVEAETELEESAEEAIEVAEEVIEAEPETVTEDQAVEEEVEEPVIEEAAEEVVAQEMEEPEDVAVEGEPKKGFFSRLFGGSDSSEEPEEILDLNGDDAEPRRNGEEAEVVEEIRVQLDQQIAVIDQELDQHPIFDFEEVEVAPVALKTGGDTPESGDWEYTGGWLKGRMHGAGTLTYPDGRIYVGEWDKGLRQGAGKLTHPSGWTFEGDWNKGLINGRGTLRYEDGWTYEGDWSNGRMDGVGVLTHPEGWTYTGEWSSGAMDGQGRLEHEDGWVYEGSWLNGVREGKGTLIHQDGWTYEGDWSKDRRSGNGTLTFSDGWSYTGEWKDGTMNGFGRLNHPDGWSYEGNWDNGAMAGEGSIVIEE